MSNWSVWRVRDANIHRSHKGISISRWLQGRCLGTLPGAVTVGHSLAVRKESKKGARGELELPQLLGWRGGVAIGNRKPGEGRRGVG